MPAQPLTVRVPAKVNLALRVGARRDDGFHPLATVFLALSLWDRLTFEPADELSLALTRPDPAVPLDESNLALRAARLLAEACGLAAGRGAAGARITIDKGIPVAGGMAGGSADAAAALVGCNELWGTGLADSELEQLAAQLGSDVPFALRGGCAAGSNRGDQLTDLACGGTFQWVAVTQREGLSTAAVYRAFDDRRGADVPEPSLDPLLVAALRDGDPVALAARLGNDLQPDALALRPDLARVLAAMTRAGLTGIVSGSGPSVLGLAPDAAAADRAAEQLQVDLPDSGVLRAHGPVPGARLG